MLIHLGVESGVLLTQGNLSPYLAETVLIKFMFITIPNVTLIKHDSFMLENN